MPWQCVPDRYVSERQFLDDASLGFVPDQCVPTQDHIQAAGNHTATHRKLFSLRANRGNPSFAYFTRHMERINVSSASGLYSPDLTYPTYNIPPSQ